MIIKIAGVIFCEIIIYTLLKQYKPEFAVISEIVSLVILIFMLSGEIKSALDTFSFFFDETGINKEYVAVLIKVSGIALVTQLCSDMCKDAGESAAASKVEFAGKVLIIAAGLPVIKGFTGFVSQLVENI